MTTVVWFRNDLRVHDNPALHAAVLNGAVVPVFVLDSKIINNPKSSANRLRFLQESLRDLQESLRSRGSNLIICQGDPTEHIPRIVQEHGAQAVHITSDITPYSRRRDAAVRTALKKIEVDLISFAGNYAIATLTDIRTKQEGVYKVFTPFWKSWTRLPRRSLVPAPQMIASPGLIGSFDIPVLYFSGAPLLSPNVQPGGEHHAHN